MTLLGYAEEHRAEVEWHLLQRYAASEIPTIPADRMARHVYAMLVDGADAEGRKKLDAALAGLDATTKAPRRELLRRAGVSEERASAITAINRPGATPIERAAAKAKLAAERRAKRKARGDA